MKYLIGLAVGGVFFGIGFYFFGLKSALFMGVLAMMITYWSNEALPLGVVSLFPVILFPLLGIMDIKSVSVNYANPIIFLFLGGFMVAIAVEKANLHKVMANKLISLFPAKYLLFGLALTSALLSAFLSNTTTALLLMPIAMHLAADKDLKIKSVLAVAYGASIGGIMTPIGTPPNLILLGFLEEEGIEPLTFAGWMIRTLPLALLMLIIVSFVLSYNTKMPKKEEIEVKINPEQKKLLMILSFMMAALFLNAFVKISDAIILLFFGLLMFVLKYLEWDDMKKIPLEIIFLFGAGFSIAKAFGSIGLAKEISELLYGVNNLSMFMMFLVIAFVITFATEVTSNTALISIALPVVYAIKPDPTVLMLATICASYAFMLPIATPPNAIAFSSGVLKIKTMAKYGVFFNIIAIVLTSLFAYFVWR
ncbi:MAG: SLC13/DASS family transporter [Epsilonproteobacteria bacterium]|nr:SLC13/DASS family transporter [Campylobacterota bacterium]